MIPEDKSSGRKERIISDVQGHISGLKAGELRALERLYRRRIDPDAIGGPEVLRAMTELSLALNRQIALMVDRRGSVQSVIVGDAHRIFLPDFGRVRAGRDRFRGLRIWLTHLAGEGLTPDNLTDLALLRLDMVLVVQVLENGLPGPFEYAHLVPANPEGKIYHIEQGPSVHALRHGFREFIRQLEDEFSREASATRKADAREGAILVGVAAGGNRLGAMESLAELARLADTAGLAVLDQFFQKRPAADPKYVVGRGKLDDIIVRAMQLGADLLIFDQDLSPSQLRSISERTDLKVLDRTQLILDIFAQHAESRAGKLQVEIAQLRYALPRLNIMTTAMSRLTGGIGGRGPGETRLEINKRRARERLTRMNRELKTVARQRNIKRAARVRNNVPIVALVGYTNAGKSTLLNVLTHSSVRAEDRLFATLDPVSRRLRFPREREIVLTDTVGFIRNLPKDLFAAFRATLEEVVEADLLLHVMDVTTADPEGHLKAVGDLLKTLEAEDTTRILVWNKVDMAPPELVDERLREYGGVPVSAAKGVNLEVLLAEIERKLWRLAHTPKREAEAPAPGV